VSNEPNSDVPTSGEPGFAKDIRHLFREIDRDEMQWAFDLWNYDDVRTNAEAIIERIYAGNMPCDVPWSNDRVEMLVAWFEAGMLP